MQGLNSGSLLAEDSPTISTPFELMKQEPQRPPSRSMVDAIRGKTAVRSVREPIQVYFEHAVADGIEKVFC
jgi:hypothetical protein